MPELTPEHRSRLAEAKRALTRDSVAIRLADLIGTPIDKGIAMLPEKARGLIDSAATSAITKALDVSIASLDGPAAKFGGQRLHLGLAALSGGVGGAFGLPALAIELPLSTVIMLRAIADIAREHGENLSEVEARLACVQVFALGGPSAKDDATDTSYFATRASFGRLAAEAAKHFAQRGAAMHEAPAVVRFITNVAMRFGIVVTEKAAAMLIPAIGAVGGAIVNSVFMDHFQAIARGHFTIRELERTYGEASVKAAYDAA
jgi:hypothetical protein